MDAFIYTALPVRVIFGSGTTSQVSDEITALGCSCALVLATPERSADAVRFAGELGIPASVFSGAAMHTPVEVTNKAMEVVKQSGADCIVALGGGSTIGLGKAIALRTDLPQIAVPTTYAGSEATPILGETENGLKTTQRSMKVLPEVIIYDVALTLTLPLSISVTSGINAIAHAAEALYAKDKNPIISMLAERGIAALARSLPRIAEDTRDLEARSDALFGAWACGTCLGAVGMALHHKLCHTLGGSFDLPHAATHTVILPHALAYNAAAAPDAMARIADAIGMEDAANGMYLLAQSLGAPSSLRELGMLPDDLPRAIDIACSAPYWNPRAIEREALSDLLHAAFYGLAPGSGR